MRMKLLGRPKLGKGLKLKLSVPSAPGMPKAAGNSAVVKTPGNSTPKMSAPMKVGTSLTVKTPKPKSMPDATDKPSVFFKSEDFSNVKHPTVQKLRDFLSNNRSKK
jgi:hypothetical protein